MTSMQVAGLLWAMAGAASLVSLFLYIILDLLFRRDLHETE